MRIKRVFLLHFQIPFTIQEHSVFAGWPATPVTDRAEVCLSFIITLFLMNPLKIKHLLQDCNMQIKFFKFSTLAASLPPKYHTASVIFESYFSRIRPQVEPLYSSFGVRAHLSTFTDMGSQYIKINSPGIFLGGTTDKTLLVKAKRRNLI